MWVWGPALYKHNYLKKKYIFNKGYYSHSGYKGPGKGKKGFMNTSQMTTLQVG
jgi:hypothetical protein